MLYNPLNFKKHNSHIHVIPVIESAALIAVDLPVSDGPDAINIGQPELTLITAE